MDELETIEHLLSRPRLYLPEESANDLLAFLAGVEWAARFSQSGQPRILELFAGIRAEFPDQYQSTSHPLTYILREMSGGDDVVAFELLREKLVPRLARLKAVSRHEVGRT